MCEYAKDLSCALCTYRNMSSPQDFQGAFAARARRDGGGGSSSGSDKTRQHRGHLLFAITKWTRCLVSRPIHSVDQRHRGSQGSKASILTYEHSVYALGERHISSITHMLRESSALTWGTVSRRLRGYEASPAHNKMSVEVGR